MGDIYTLLLTERARPLPPLPTERHAMMRMAGDLIGSERLARLLNVKPRSLYNMMAGKVPVKDGVLSDTRRHLIDQRHALSTLIRAIREAEGGDHANQD